MPRDRQHPDITMAPCVDSQGAIVVKARYRPISQRGTPIEKRPARPSDKQAFDGWAGRFLRRFLPPPQNANAQNPNRSKRGRVDLHTLPRWAECGAR